MATRLSQGLEPPTPETRLVHRSQSVVAIAGCTQRVTQRFPATFSAYRFAVAVYLFVCAPIYSSLRKRSKPSGNRASSELEDSIIAAADTAAVTLPDNAGRHTFISMHVAYHESIDKTALEADTSAEIIKSDYLDIVTKPEATKFWAIRPKNA